jgi:hypothetical protein
MTRQARQGIKAGTARRQGIIIGHHRQGIGIGRQGIGIGKASSVGRHQGKASVGHHRSSSSARHRSASALSVGIGHRHQGKDAGQTPQDGKDSKVAQYSHIDFEESVIMRSYEKFLSGFKIYTKEVLRKCVARSAADRVQVACASSAGLKKRGRNCQSGTQSCRTASGR